MSTASKVILGLIIFASLPLAYFSMRALKTHDEWRTAYEDAQDKLARSEISARLLKDNGDQVALSDRRMYERGAAEPEPGVRQLTQRLRSVLADRGRAWYEATPISVDANTSTATVQLGPLPDPHNITPDMTVFVFDERDARITPENPQAGHYLGEFIIIAADGPNVQFQPSMAFSAAERERIAASQQSGGTWAIYEVMPVDRGGMYAGLTNEELQALMPDVPQSARDQYLKDGKSAEPGDPAEDVVDGIYRRPVRDYMVIFREHHRQRALDADTIVSKTKENELLAADLADAARQQAFRRKEIADLNELLARTAAELDLVKRLHDQYEAKLDVFLRQMEEALEENKRKAAELKAVQLQAAQKIDEATASQQANAAE